MKTKTIAIRKTSIFLLSVAGILTIGSASAAEHHDMAGHHKCCGAADVSMTAEEAIENWMDEPRKVAKTIIEKYGQPDEVTPKRLIWHNNGPWLRTELVDQKIPHFFPIKHNDMLKQTIAMLVPSEKFSDLAAYDGSVIVERTKGTLSARCDKESMNFLALNLAKDVIDGKKSVKEAREAYASIAMKVMNGGKDPYTDGLAFEVPKAPKGDPGEVAKMAKK